MHWRDIPGLLAQLYGSVAHWVFNHEVEADLLVVATVVGTIAVVLRRHQRRRRKLLRLQWGKLINMKRKDFLAKQLLRFEDAFLDAAMDMVSKGEMTPQQEVVWFEFFAKQLSMKGLVPVKTVKRSIQRRIANPILFGGMPIKFPDSKETKSTTSLAKSRFRNGGEDGK